MNLFMRYNFVLQLEGVKENVTWRVHFHRGLISKETQNKVWDKDDFCIQNYVFTLEKIGMTNTAEFTTYPQWTFF